MKKIQTTMVDEVEYVVKKQQGLVYEETSR